MPRVPVYDSLTVNPTGLPTPRFDAPNVAANVANAPMGEVTNVPDFAGRQAQLSGQALESAGLAIDRMMLEAQREANQLRVDDVLNKTKELALKLTYDKDVGFLNAKGVDALDRQSGMPLADEYADRLKKEVESLSETLGNDAQKQAYAKRANDMILQLRGQAMNHESQEFKTYALSVREGTIKTRMNEIGFNYNNPEVVDQAVESIRAAAYDSARLLGKSGTWADAEARKMVSNAHLVAVSTALEKNDVAYADAYLKKYGKQMEADDILRVQGHITKDMDGRVALGVASNVMQTVGGRFQTAPIDRALNIVGKIKPAVVSDDAPVGVAPVANATVTSGFGPRIDPIKGGRANHEGIDFAAPAGSPVLASAAGKVKAVSKEAGGYGVMVEIEHPNGYVTRYAHLSEADVKVGQQVNAGDPVAKVGNTGKSTGPHLHFEVRKGDKAVDPVAFLKQGGRAREQFATYMNDYQGDITKSFGAMMYGNDKVDAAVANGRKKGVDWVSLMSTEEQAQIKQAVSEFGSGQGSFTRPTLQDVHNQVRMQLGPQTSPTRLKLALDESTRQFNEMTAAIKQREEEVVAEVQRTLIANGGNFAQIPFQLRSQIPPDKYDNLMDFAGKIGKGTPIQTDWALYYELKSDPQALASTNLMAVRDKLGDTEFKNLTEQQQNIRQGKEDLYTRARTVKDVMNNLMIQAGIDPTPKDGDKKGAEKVGRIWSAFEGKVRSIEEATGRKMTYEDLQKTAAEMFTKFEVDGWINSNEPKALITENDTVIVPAEDRKQIIAALRANQKPVTDDAIEALYRQKNGITPKKAK